MSTKTEQQQSTGSRIAPADYGRILQGVQLVSIRLAGCSASSNAEVVHATLSQGKPIPVETGEASEFALVDGNVNVRHSYILKAKSGRTQVLAVRGEYELVFRSSESFTEEFFDVFRELALPMFTWPYFRELVGSMTGRMELPTLNLELRHTPRF